MSIETQPYKHTEEQVMSELVRVCEKMWAQETMQGKPDVASEWRYQSCKLKNDFDPDMYPYPDEVTEYIKERKSK